MVAQEISKKELLAQVTPTIIELFEKADHEVGFSDSEGDEYETNYFCYDQNGWDIELCYECCGKWHIERGDYWTPPSEDLVKVWGNIVELTATYYDEESEEVIEFDDEDLKDLRSEIMEIIESLAC